MDRGPDICPHLIFVTVDYVSPRLIEGLTEAVKDGYADWVCIPTGSSRRQFAPTPAPARVVPK